MTMPDLQQTSEENLEPTQPQEDTSDHSEEADSSAESSASAPDNEELRILQQVAQNATRQNQILQQQMLEMRQQLEGVSQTVSNANKPAARPIVTDEDFQTSPAAAMERLFDAKLDEKLSRTIAPLLESQKEAQRERMFNQGFATTLSSINPALMPYAESLAPTVKQIIGNADPTPQALAMATYIAIGQYAASGQQTPMTQSSTPQTTPSMERRPAPPSVPSSAPRSAAPAKPKLTEAQLRAFNKLGYKAGQEAEFLKFLEADEVSF